MRRYSSSPYAVSYSFGPGPLSPAIKVLIAANAGAFLVQALLPRVTYWFGLMPAAVVEDLRVWQLASYMFLHAGLFHIVFNMLALWMFGTELERIWGTQQFLKFYFVCGIGAAFLTVLFSLLPFGFAQPVYQSIVIGASGAIYGLLLAYALYFPDRPILAFMLFPMPAKYFVLLIGAIAFYSSLGAGSGVANATHLGGLAVGYLFLKGPRGRADLLSEVKYRYLKWRINRVRKKFDVYSGGRADDYDRRIH
jgi:membrane associated rhomboid family serine protease